MHPVHPLQPRAVAARFACSLVVALTLSACGGGGGGSEGQALSPSNSYDTSAPASQPENVQPEPEKATPDNSPPAEAPAQTTPDPSNIPSTEGAAARLLISEVGSNYYVNDVAWFEVYNPDERAVSLRGYALRSSYVDAATSTMSLAPMTFSLPAVTVPARGYLVIASRVYDNLKDNRQIVYVGNGSATPFWNGNGSLELVVDGETADFIRFGTSTAAPLTTAEWGGANVSSLPSGVNEYGRSIVRLAAGGMADSNSARDWSLVNFATPAGINDIAPGVVDSDRDGVPDSAKVRGGTYAGLDLYAMGARPGRRDLFVEIDYMQSADAGTTPHREALQKLVNTFVGQDVAIHLDTGNLHGPAFDPLQFNLGGGDPVTFAPCIQMAAASEDMSPSCTSFYDIKSRHFDVRRKFLFHYAIFGNSLNTDGSAGPSGMAELYGNDLVVTLGKYGLSSASEIALNLLLNLQASTLMHELGHNLGLHHGGNEDMNYKPNHYSVMNYMYQFAGLSETPDSVHAAERYYLANNLKGKTYCNLAENSPCSSNFRIGYSNGSSIDLDENALQEPANIGRGSAPGAYADWDDDGVPTAASLARNITPQMGGAMTVLRDFDEWGNLVFAFSRHFSGATTGSSFARRANVPRSNPMNQAPVNKLTEPPLPSVLLDDIRNAIGVRHGRAHAEGG